MINYVASSAITPSTPSPITTLRLTDDEIKAKIRADVAVVSNLKDLEVSFGRMIVKVKRHLEKCDLSEFLFSVIGTKVLTGVKTLEKF